jgi:hypothetical protein
MAKVTEKLEKEMSTPQVFALRKLRSSRSIRVFDRLGINLMAIHHISLI